MEAQMIAAIVAGILVGILLFFFLCFFFTHCCCPWRYVLRPWKKNTKLQWQLENGHLDQDVEPPHHMPPTPPLDEKPVVIPEPIPEEPEVAYVPEVEIEPEPEVSTFREPEPEPEPIEYEPSEKEYEEPVTSKRPPSIIVSRITAAIEEKHVLTGDYSYEHVQENTLPRVHEDTEYNIDKPSSPVYSEPYDSLENKKMNNLNEVTRSSPVLIRSGLGRGTDGDNSSLASDQSKVQSMIKSFHNLSRNNSSASNRETIYSKPDMFRKSAINRSASPTSPASPMSLADFMHKEQLPHLVDTDGSTPTIPPKDYDEVAFNQ